MAQPKRTARKSRRPYHHGNLRRALLDEALAMIRSEGVDAVTLREIGARVGVSRTALYRHFADKRALLAAVATEGFRTLRSELTNAWEQGGRDDDAFRAMGEAYVRFAIANPSHYRVMFGGFINTEYHDLQLAAEATGAFQALVDAVVTLQRSRVFRDDDTLLISRYTWALVHGLAMLGINGQLHEPEAVEELMGYSFDRLRTGVAIPVKKSRTKLA